VRRGAALACLVAGALSGCVTLTPAQEVAVAEVRALADDTARVYGVPRIAVLVGRNVDGVGGTYRRGLFTVSTPMLGSRYRDSVVAHELAHYVLEHDRPLAGTLMLDLQREQEARELDANAKAVEILVRVRGYREEQALSLVYDHLLSVDRAVARRTTVIPWGHRPPCDEMIDLVARFPAHRGWTAGLPCSDPRAPTEAAARPPARPGAVRDAAATGPLVHSYFTDRVPERNAAMQTSDAEALPRPLGVFDRARDTQVALFLGVRAGDRPRRVVSRWYDETGTERRVVARMVPADTADAWTRHTHTVPMWELRPYPGRWTARVWIDDTPAGEYAFSLAR
jgi:IrrE N-terminal-like domain